jgi:hypothetical protein
MKTNLRIPNNQLYSEAFEHQVARAYELSEAKKDMLMEKHQIRGHCTILQWCERIVDLYTQSHALKIVH